MTMLGVALDVPTIAKAKPIIRQLASLVDVFKFHSLSDRPGIDAVVKLVQATGKKTFWDPKANDAPKTMAARIGNAADAGVDFVTVHASSGPAGMEAAVKAAGDTTKVLAVTLLTTMDEATVRSIFNAYIEKKLIQFVNHCKEAGISGLVCSPLELKFLREMHESKHWFLATPGIRQPDWPKLGQERVGTARFAVEHGSDLLIVGGPAINPENGTRQLILKQLRIDMEKAKRPQGEANALYPKG